MYSVADYGKMIIDRVRIDAYAEALRRVVTPSSVVLDIGAGTGIMSLLACRAGARRVYAVEPSGAVQLAVEAARDNGYGDRIVVLQRRSNDVTLPERADVIVSDMRGVLPPFQTHFADLVDARQRLLAPGGRLVPEVDTLWAAVVSAPEAFAEPRRPWEGQPHGLDLRSGLPFIDNAAEKHSARAEDLLSAPLQWARLAYPTLVEPNLRGAGTLPVTRTGTAHGLLVWFDTTLVEGVGYSNAPGAPEIAIYCQYLFRWPEAVALRAGDAVAFDLRADPVGGEVLWTWSTEIRGAGDGPPASAFRQSTFKSLLTSPEALHRRGAAFKPTLSAAGEGALEVLAGIRAGRTVGELAEALRAAHPQRFSSLDAAHGFVAELAERYGA